MISGIESESEGFYVEFDGEYFEGDKNQQVRIWTRKIQRRRDESPDDEEKEEVPLVMVHGLAAGTAMFAINFDGLAQYRYIFFDGLKKKCFGQKMQGKSEGAIGAAMTKSVEINPNMI